MTYIRCHWCPRSASFTVTVGDQPPRPACSVHLRAHRFAHRASAAPLPPAVWREERRSARATARALGGALLFLLSLLLLAQVCIVLPLSR